MNKKSSILNKNRAIFYLILFFLGILIAIFDFYLIGVTIINFRIPISISIGVAIVSYKIDLPNYLKTYTKTSQIFFFFQCFVTWGAFAVFIFMGSNFNFLDYTFKDKEFKIIEKEKIFTKEGRREKRDIPAFILVIEKKGHKEEVIFTKVNHNDFDKIKSVTLSIKKGYWDFDVYNSQRINWKE